MNQPDRYRLSLAFVVLLLGLSFCLLPLSPVSAESWRDKTFILGAISEQPQQRHTAMITLVERFLPHLKDLGYEATDVLYARDLEEMIRHMRDGNLDAISADAFAAVRLIDEGGAEPLLREWKDGVASYRSVFVASKGAGIHRLADLKGKRLAFDAGASPMAFRIPLSILRTAGLEAVLLDNVHQPLKPGNVGYVFAKSQAEQFAWLAQNAAAAAFSNLAWEALRGGKAAAENLEVIHESAPIMRSMLLVRGGMSAATKAGAAGVILGLAATEAGRRILEDYNGVKKYDLPPAQALTESLVRVRRWKALTADATN